MSGASRSPWRGSCHSRASGYRLVQVPTFLLRVRVAPGGSVLFTVELSHAAVDCGCGEVFLDGVLVGTWCGLGGP